jgi:hypothetical protein
VSSSENAIRNTSDEGVFELAGSRPCWIWVQTCRAPKCDCRAALVVATSAGRDVLLERGAAVHDAWVARKNYDEVASRLGDLDHFFVDIDTAEVYWTNGESRLDVSEHPRIGAIAERIDGDVLDGIGRLWYRGKGRPDPEEQILLAKEVVPRGWERGALIMWNDLCTGLRQDIYVLGRHHYEAVELYCPVPDCDCGEVVVDFEALLPRGAPSPGNIVMHSSGAARIEPHKQGRHRLEQLWAAFQKRHPNFVARFARRDAVLKNIGKRFVTAERAGAASNVKIGRNDPCPCGSGRKYKKCCGVPPQ